MFSPSRLTPQGVLSLSPSDPACRALPLSRLTGQGVRAVIAETYERIHRSNLVGMGIVPLQYRPGQTADSLGLTGRETFTIQLPPSDTLSPGMDIPVTVRRRRQTSRSR